MGTLLIPFRVQKYLAGLRYPVCKHNVLVYAL